MQNVNLICNTLYLNFNIWYFILMCVDCVLASPRITQVCPSRRALPLMWFCHRVEAVMPTILLYGSPRV
jgi:hypothetical protein